MFVIFSISPVPISCPVLPFHSATFKSQLEAALTLQYTEISVRYPVIAGDTPTTNALLFRFVEPVDAPAVHFPKGVKLSELELDVELELVELELVELELVDELLELVSLQTQIA